MIITQKGSQLQVSVKLLWHVYPRPVNNSGSESDRLQLVHASWFFGEVANLQQWWGQVLASCEELTRMNCHMQFNNKWHFSVIQTLGIESRASKLYPVCLRWQGMCSSALTISDFNGREANRYVTGTLLKGASSYSFGAPCWYEGRRWQYLRLCNCDNSSVVEILHNGYTRGCCLFYTTECHQNVIYNWKQNIYPGKLKRLPCVIITGSPVTLRKICTKWWEVDSLNTYASITDNGRARDQK